jgi:hypothetical protein
VAAVKWPIVLAVVLTAVLEVLDSRLHELAIGMEPEDGVIWVYGTTDIEVLAFTPFGIENLRELIAMENGRQA